MLSRVFVFPGQGSQAVSMGKDFYDNFVAAKETFEFVDDTLGYNLSDIIFNGPAHELTLTKHAQGALMTVSIAIINSIKSELGLKDISTLCNYVAGHSLGEYSALCAAGALDLKTTTELLKVRGRSMQDAASNTKGGMVACISARISELEDVVSTVKSMGMECSIANDNSENQVVISGAEEAMDMVINILKDSGKKAIKLNVSGAFHSNLMKDAQDIMEKALDQAVIQKPLVPLIANISAMLTSDPEEIRSNLKSQICSRVRWRETIETFVSLGAEEIVEIGSGKVLSSMIKKGQYCDQVKSYTISNLADFDHALKLFTSSINKASSAN